MKMRWCCTDHGRSIHRNIYLWQINLANYMALKSFDGCLPGAGIDCSSSRAAIGGMRDRVRLEDGDRLSEAKCNLLQIRADLLAANEWMAGNIIRQGRFRKEDKNSRTEP